MAEISHNSAVLATPYSGNFPAVRRGFFHKVLHTLTPFAFAPRHLVDYFEAQRDFLYLPEKLSAKYNFTPENITFSLFALWFLAGVLAYATVLFETSIPVALMGVATVFYTLVLIFKLFITHQSLKGAIISVSKEELSDLSDADLPTYTILIPLYQESEVIQQIKSAMSAIDYPAEKLDIIITLEEYDHATINAIVEAGFPNHFKVLILPNVTPKTKPKALNVAFPHIKGEFFVIYDAEIIPDTDQLRKAVVAFRQFSDLSVLQTRLDHYNVRQNWLTRLFNIEFSFYYDLFLPGLQKFNFPLPLSGHSTHFRTSAVESVGAWDPYNVAEDCDIGMRLAASGHPSGVLDSVSKEEATTSINSWVKQRTRWMKGFMQTAIVSLRHPFHFYHSIGGFRNFAVFLLVVPGTVFINILNLVSTVLLALWILTGAGWIKELFPMSILYLSVFSFLTGTFVFTYLNLLGAYVRGRYDLVKWALLSPIYWMLLAYASTRALVQLVTSPHTWEKTSHGTHLKDQKVRAA